MGRMWRSEDEFGCRSSSPTLFATGPLFHHRVPQTSCPTSSQIVSCLYLPFHSRDTRATDTCYCAQLCMGSGDSNSGTHSSAASMLPTEPSQPLTQLLPAKDTYLGHLKQKQVRGSRINTDLSPETKEVMGGQRHWGMGMSVQHRKKLLNSSMTTCVTSSRHGQRACAPVTFALR